MIMLTVELNSPFDYNNGKEDVSASFIEITAPNGKIAHYAANLKSMIKSSSKNALVGVDLSSFVVDEPDKGASEVDETSPEYLADQGEAVYEIIMAGGIDMAVVMTTFKEILKASATAGGEKAFTSPMFDRMSFDDVEKALKLYIGYFMMG